MEFDLSIMRRSALSIVLNTLPKIHLGVAPKWEFPMELIAVPPIKENKYTFQIWPSIRFTEKGIKLFEFTMKATLQVNNTVNEAYFFEAAVEFASMIIYEYNLNLWNAESSLTRGNPVTQHPTPSKQELKSKIMTDYAANSLQ